MRWTPPAPAIRPSARFWESEAGVIRRDDDVAGERNFAAAAQREAIHRGDNRLVDIEPGRIPAKPPLLR